MHLLALHDLPKEVEHLAPPHLLALRDLPKEVEHLAPPHTAKNLRDRPHERPILQGLAFLAAGNAHGSIASSLAISFASRVVAAVLHPA